MIDCNKHPLLDRMDIYSRPGTKVIFDNPTAGYKHDQEYCRKHLIVGRVYTIHYTEVHSSSTDVYLVGFPGSFNSVMFGELN